MKQLSKILMLIFSLLAPLGVLFSQSCDAEELALLYHHAISSDLSTIVASARVLN